VLLKGLRVYSGFMQPKHISNGCLDLVESIKEDPRYDEETMIAVYGRWWVGQPGAVKEILRTIDPAGKIYLAGHSFGGYSAARLCDLLHEAGREVEALFLCDAVHHGKTAAERAQTIQVSPSVKNVYVWQQHDHSPLMPKGSPVAYAKSQLRLLRPDMPLGHNQMDSAPEFLVTVTSVFFGG
jgi:pimeloyl-ACP methyl ester carboxylesterase